MKGKRENPLISLPSKSATQFLNSKKPSISTKFLLTIFYS